MSEKQKEKLFEEMVTNLKVAYEVADDLDKHSIIDLKILRETVFDI